MRVFLTANFVFVTVINIVNCAPQQVPEINDQFQLSNHTEVKTKNTQHEEANSIIDEIIIPEPNNETRADPLEINEIALTEIEPPSFMTRFFIAFKKPIVDFMEVPKVSIILKNVGTCIVNGAMEIVSIYFPAPLIPLIASAAGMMIPFEPVVTLRKRMPVTSYRRAFHTALNSFMGTFDRFKNDEEDPYMTRRFNRRFMEDNSKDESMKIRE